MKNTQSWKAGRLVKIGLSAAVLPTFLIGLVALEQTDTGPSTTESSELIQHKVDCDKKGNDCDEDDDDGKVDCDKKGNDCGKDDDDDGKDQEDNDGEDNRCADAESKEEQATCRDPSGVLP